VKIKNKLPLTTLPYKTNKETTKQTMKLKPTILFLAVGTLLSLQSCDKAKFGTEEPTEPTDPNLKITYTEHISKTMTNHCITCHAGVAASAGLDLTTYANVKSAAENNNMMGWMNNAANPMPKSGLISVAERAQVQKWIDEGFAQ
jgi:uncharacterized membrane protein